MDFESESYVGLRQYLLLLLLLLYVVCVCSIVIEHIKICEWPSHWPWHKSLFTWGRIAFARMNIVWTSLQEFHQSVCNFRVPWNERFDHEWSTRTEKWEHASLPTKPHSTTICSLCEWCTFCTCQLTILWKVKCILTERFPLQSRG